MMRLFLGFLLLIFIFSNEQAFSFPPAGPGYVLSNNLQQTIGVEVLKENGTSKRKNILKPGRKISLKGVRRFQIHLSSGNIREYALFMHLDIPLPAWGSGKTKFESIITGKWELTIAEKDMLEIRYIGGAIVSDIPDFAKPPLLFPLRPRSSTQTFEEYRRHLTEEIKRALVAN